MTIIAEQTTNSKAHNHQHVISEWHTVRLHKSTLAKLHRLEKFKESYSEVVDRMVSEALGLSVPPEEGSW